MKKNNALAWLEVSPVGKGEVRSIHPTEFGGAILILNFLKTNPTLLSNLVIIRRQECIFQPGNFNEFMNIFLSVIQSRATVRHLVFVNALKANVC